MALIQGTGSCHASVQQLQDSFLPELCPGLLVDVYFAIQLCWEQQVLAWQLLMLWCSTLLVNASVQLRSLDSDAEISMALQLTCWCGNQQGMAMP